MLKERGDEKSEYLDLRFAILLSRVGIHFRATDARSRKGAIRLSVRFSVSVSTPGESLIIGDAIGVTILGKFGTYRSQVQSPQTLVPSTRNLRQTGADVTNFTHRINAYEAADVESAVVTVREHHPEDRIWAVRFYLTRTRIASAGAACSASQL